MGKALEVISGRVTAPGAALTALTMNGNDSATVKNSPTSTDVRLIQFWGRNQVAGIFQIRSPRLHDNVRGIRTRITANAAIPLQPPGIVQRLIPQDQLILELSGSAVAGQIEHGALMIYYNDLQGTDARFISPDDLTKRAVQLVTQENVLAPGAGGDYSGQVALNANSDLLIANTDYAVVGYLVDAQCSGVFLRGPDTGNLRVGGPGNQTLRHVTARWFKHLSEALGMALIPVINSANKAATFVDALQDQAAAAVNVTWILQQLGGGGVGAGGR